MTTATEIADILDKLTDMQRLYVQARIQGMSQVASATAAGASNPKRNAHKFEQSANVKAAIRQSREIFAQKLSFDRKKAHDMYMHAYQVADNATEMKMCVDSLVKLHGVASPEVKRLQHEHTGRVTHDGQVALIPDQKLIEMANVKPSEDPNVIEGELVAPELPPPENKDEES